MVDELVARRMIERVPPDPDTARAWLEDADRHLEAASRILDVDLAGAYSLIYDAARKAMAAVMLAEGLRARAVPGSHQAVARFAETIAAGDTDLATLQRLDAMRRNRNRSEYGRRVFGRAEVERDLAHARRMVAIASRRTGG